MKLTCNKSLRRASKCSPLTSVINNGPKVINGIMWRCIHQQITCVTHLVLDDKSLVHGGPWTWTSPDNVVKSTQSSLPILDKVETGRGRTGFCYYRTTCNSRKHYTVNTIDFTHCVSVKIPGLTSICEQRSHCLFVKSNNRNLTFWEMWGESNTWISFPHLDIVIVTLAPTS